MSGSGSPAHLGVLALRQRDFLMSLGVATMDLDDLFVRYFGTTEYDEVGADVTSAGLKRILREFARKGDDHERFRLWSLLLLHGQPPELR